MADPNDHSSRSVEFISGGLSIRGSLILPNSSGPHPIVVLGHGFGGVKDWTIPEIMRAFAKVGIAGIGFDFRNFGSSDGTPRGEVAHLDRLQNWQDAISYVSGLSEVDSERIGIWGTSLGGRDVLAMGATDRRVKAIVAQVPVIQWSAASAARMAGYGDNLESYHRDVAEDRKDRLMGKAPRYIPFVREGDDAKREFLESLSQEELGHYQELVTLQSYAPTVLTDIMPLVAQIAPTPVRFILAKDDRVPGQRAAFAAAKSPKSLVEIDGHHFSPYTTSKKDAIKAAKDWFAVYLLAIE